MSLYYTFILKKEVCFGGAKGDRTPDLNAASVALSQLSYGPKKFLILPKYIFEVNLYSI